MAGPSLSTPSLPSPTPEGPGEALGKEAGGEPDRRPLGWIEAQPLSPAEALPPARLQIPDIGLDVPVVPMGWRIAVIGGVRTTEWIVPEDAAGWHVNSAKAGARGNVVISGHQLLGTAVFQPIALGDVQEGQEIRLTDASGRTFIYQVQQVSEPIPIGVDLVQERTIAAQYTGPTAEARLTLVTGWPDYASTHRVFVVATWRGRAGP